MPELINTIMARQASKFVGVFLLEVGSFSGGSAIRIVNESRNLALPPERFCMMCVDTWLGDVNMMADIFADGQRTGYRSWLQWDSRHQAHIMDTFCGNVARAGVSRSVVPLRAPSIVGMKVLQRFVNARRLPRPAMLYLDSAHEELETLVELGIAWNLIAEDGILFGDDYGWEAVGRDVRRFAYLKGIDVYLYQTQWILHKPVGSGSAGGKSGGGGSWGYRQSKRSLPLGPELDVSASVEEEVVVRNLYSLEELRAAVNAF